MTAQDPETLLALFESMALIRQVELRLGRLFAEGEVPGFIHLSIGQEAVAAGVGHALRPEDTVASTHRGHGHALTKGIALDLFFSELMGREEGICKGRGGSMHVASMATGMLGANAIVGASIPIALGSALAHQVKRTGVVAVGFFGDGAMAEGTLHESLNLASLWKLPLLFACENNGWAEFSPTRKQFVAPLSKLAEAFGVPHAQVDGGDVLAVVEATATALAALRQGRGPQVLEFITHRFRGHYEGDPQKYRDAAELAGTAQHDPLVRFAPVLAAAGIDDARQQTALANVEERVERAVEKARRGSSPDFSAGRGDVYSPVEAV